MKAGSRYPRKTTWHLAQLPGECLPANMLPMGTGFDRRLHAVLRELIHFEFGKIHESIHYEVLSLPCRKPAQPRPPSADDLRRVAPYERAFKEVLDAQKRRGFDAEALTEAFAPLLKEVADIQGIGAHTVDLSCDALSALPGLEGKVLELREVPEELRLLQAEVRELKMNCCALAVVPEWLGELVHLEVLSLDGSYNDAGEPHNSSLCVLPASLGALHALKTLTLQNFKALKALPESIARLTSLETLHIKFCPVLKELPAMNAMPALRSLTLYGCVSELPACLGDWGLQYLVLKRLDLLQNLPASLSRLTSLETLLIKNCSTLQELPAMGVITRLTSLTLIDCALKRLPCFGGLIALRHLTLGNLCNLIRLPSSIGKLSDLRTLTLCGCNRIMELPSIGSLLSLATLYIENCALRELPTSITVLTSLHKLVLSSLPKLQALPACIGALTTLTELTVCDCGITDVPSSIESLTNLRTLWLGTQAAARQDGRAFKTLACALPALRLLQRLDLRWLCEDDVLALGHSLKAWPLPLLGLGCSFWHATGNKYICLNSCWQALALPPEAVIWNNTAILQHWRVQQHKVAAFASGLHARLGAASWVSSLNDMALVLIADEVLGGWSLLKLWQRERLAREVETVSSSSM